MFREAYRNRSVLVTGDSGFKGSWLCEWLLGLGAEVTGFSLPPPTSPSLFEQLGLAGRIRHVGGDVGDQAAVDRAVASCNPDYVFHLAAQSLVRPSFDSPVETFETNAIGTARVLEAVRRSGRACRVVAVTTDKCYENREWVHSYREDDPLGGYDPYSASKAAAEIVISSFRRSFFGAGSGVRLASARSGNVIGGGDWAADRIVPDCIRSLRAGAPIAVRNPNSTRPWQHVLEPLSGYLWLGACLDDPARAREGGPALDGAFNFGPGLQGNRRVGELVSEILGHWPGRRIDAADANAGHEASLLNLAIDKAWHKLGWRPLWPFEASVKAAIAWYREVESLPQSAPAATRAQIELYMKDAQSAGLPWSR
jgi:CDP-glucose 4,6-dehydratase